MKLLKFPTKDDIEADEEIARKAVLLDVICAMAEMVDAGEITEFVAASVDKYGEVQAHLCTHDYITGVGLFEIGKNTLLSLGAGEE